MQKALAGSARARSLSLCAGAIAAVLFYFGSVSTAVLRAETVTIGAVDLSGTTAFVGCVGGGACTATYAQLTQPTPGVLLEAPADGVITSWRVHGDAGETGSLALRVLRDEDGGGGRLTGVARSPAVAAGETDGSPPHQVSIPVIAGDFIGVDVLHPAVVFYTTPAGAIFGKWEGFPEGLKAGPDNTLSGRLMLNAVESLKATVSAVSPASGSTAGGETVTISGASLDGATSVKFGDVAAPSFTPAAQGITSEFITATAPPGGPGAVHVQVSGPGGVSYATSADVYTYVTPPPPSIVIASPVNGTTYRQGQLVTADYSCAASAGATVSACTGPVAMGAVIDTTAIGPHRFTVNAKASTGATASQTALYTVTTAGLLSAGLTLPGMGTGLPGGPPVIANLSETSKRWSEHKASARAGAKKRPVGTTFSFTLNEPATVALRFAQKSVARNVHGRCVALQRATEAGRAVCAGLPRAASLMRATPASTGLASEGALPPRGN